MITIITSILFSFGLTFIISNIQDWNTFILIAAMHTFINIIANGSLLSRELRDIQNIARNISIKFLISTCSSLTMVVYFAMTIASTKTNINIKVFGYLATLFGIESIIFYVQITMFKENERVYIVSLIEKCFDVLMCSLILAFGWIGGIPCSYLISIFMQN